MGKVINASTFQQLVLEATGIKATPRDVNYFVPDWAWVDKAPSIFGWKSYKYLKEGLDCDDRARILWVEWLQKYQKTKEIKQGLALPMGAVDFTMPDWRGHCVNFMVVLIMGVPVVKFYERLDNSVNAYTIVGKVTSVYL